MAYAGARINTHAAVATAATANLSGTWRPGPACSAKTQHAVAYRRYRSALAKCPSGSPQQLQPMASSSAPVRLYACRLIPLFRQGFFRALLGKTGAAACRGEATRSRLLALEDWRGRGAPIRPLPRAGRTRRDFPSHPAGALGRGALG